MHGNKASNDWSLELKQHYMLLTSTESITAISSLVRERRLLMNANLKDSKRKLRSATRKPGFVQKALCVKVLLLDGIPKPGCHIHSGFHHPKQGRPLKTSTLRSNPISFSLFKENGEKEELLKGTTI